MESVGFKEWAIVCEALGRGEQCILLRKGGIAEGRAGFGFRHAEFCLFPTFFHEQVAKTRVAEAELPAQRPGEIEIKFFVKVEQAMLLDSWEAAVALAPLHILKQEVVRERFDYDAAPFIHVAFVRVFRLEPSWCLPDAREFGGCRSWVELPEVSEQRRMKPVVRDEEHARNAEEFRATTKL